MSATLKKRKRFIPEIEIDKKSSLPLHIQLANILKSSLVRNRVKPGTALPSERKISEHLDINRSTVHRAYEQLICEGLAEELKGRQGLFVASSARKRYRQPFPAIGIVMPVAFSEFINIGSRNSLSYLSGVIDRATELDHSTMILNLPPPDASPEKVRQWLDNHTSRLSGIICLGDRKNPEDTSFRELAEHQQIPQVFLSGYADEFSHISSVYGDPLPGGTAAAELLRDKGHRRIGIIDTSPHFRQKAIFKNYALKRKEIMHKCFSNCNLEVRREWNVSCDLNEESVFAALRKMFSRSETPTALWCHNDVTALVAVKVLRKMGIEVPAQVSVIGFDDIQEARESTPALTTIKMPCYSAGRTAVDLAHDLFEHGAPGKAKYIKIPTSLVVRESVTGVNEGIYRK